MQLTAAFRPTAEAAADSCRAVVRGGDYTRSHATDPQPPRRLRRDGGRRPAAAWGDLGHEVTALIAYRHLTPADFASRATYADKYRTGHRETAAWHFVNIELDHTDLASPVSGRRCPSGFWR